MLKLEAARYTEHAMLSAEKTDFSQTQFARNDKSRLDVYCSELKVFAGTSLKATYLSRKTENLT